MLLQPIANQACRAIGVKDICRMPLKNFQGLLGIRAGQRSVGNQPSEQSGPNASTGLAEPRPSGAGALGPGERFQPTTTDRRKPDLIAHAKREGQEHHLSACRFRHPSQKVGLAVACPGSGQEHQRLAGFATRILLPVIDGVA